MRSLEKISIFYWHTAWPYKNGNGKNNRQLIVQSKYRKYSIQKKCYHTSLYHNVGLRINKQGRSKNVHKKRIIRKNAWFSAEGPWHRQWVGGDRRSVDSFPICAPRIDSLCLCYVDVVSSTSQFNTFLASISNRRLSSTALGNSVFWIKQSLFIFLFACLFAWSCALVEVWRFCTVMLSYQSSIYNQNL